MRHIRPNEIEPDDVQAAIKRFWARKNREHQPGELRPENNMTCEECGECYLHCPSVYWCPYCSEGY